MSVNNLLAPIFVLLVFDTDLIAAFCVYIYFLGLARLQPVT